MDKLQFGTFDPTENEYVFDDNVGYTEPSNEEEVRKQLSYPLKEIKDYVNNTVTVSSTDSNRVYQLALTGDRLIKYRQGPDDTWKDTASSGHTILDENDNPVTQKVNIKFKNATVYNSGNTTVVEGFKGDTGDTGPQGPIGPQGTSFKILGHFDTFNDLDNYITDPEIGDAYAVGNRYGVPYDIYVFGYYLTSGGLLPPQVQDGWVNIGNVSQIGATGADGAKGDSGSFEILDLLEDSSDLPDDASTGDAYAVSTEDGWDAYIYNGEEWVNLGSLKGPQGPEGPQGASGEGALPDGGTVGQVVVKKSLNDYDAEWRTIIDSSFDGTSDNAQSGKAVLNAIKSLYPVGSVYVVGNASSDPNTILGFGTWVKYDQGFSDVVIKNTDAGFNIADYFTINTSYAYEVQSFRLERNNKTIRVTLKIKTKELSTTARVLGTFTLSGLGLSAYTQPVYFTGSTSNRQVTSYMEFNVDRELKHVRENASSSTIADKSVLLVDFEPIFDKSEMLDSACDKFYWRRTE